MFKVLTVNILKSSVCFIKNKISLEWRILLHLPYKPCQWQMTRLRIGRQTRSRAQYCNVDGYGSVMCRCAMLRGKWQNANKPNFPIKFKARCIDFFQFDFGCYTRVSSGICLAMPIANNVQPRMQLDRYRKRDREKKTSYLRMWCRVRVRCRWPAHLLQSLGWY